MRLFFARIEFHGKNANVVVTFRDDLIDYVVVDTATRRVEMHLHDATARATGIANESAA
jgi:hypothetical protein